MRRRTTSATWRAEHGTPAYVLDEADLRAALPRLPRRRSAAPTSTTPPRRSCCTAVARWVDEEGLGLDVCTGGELAVALRGRLPRRPDRPARQQQVRRRAGRGRSTPASAGSSSTRSTRSTGWPALRRERGVRQPVLVRATVGVEAHTHEFIATAHEDQKFGFSLAGGDAFEAARRVLGRRRAGAGRAALAHRLADLRHRRLRGRRPPGGRAAGPGPRRARRRAARAGPRRRLRHRLHERRTTRSTSGDMAASLRTIVERECAGVRAGRAARWRSSPAGRIVGPATVTLYEVGTVKDVDGPADLRLASTAG